MTHLPESRILPTTQGSTTTRLGVAAMAAVALGAIALTTVQTGSPASAGGQSGVGQGPVGAYACRQYLENPDDSYLPPEATKWRVHSGTVAEAPNGDMLYAFYGGRTEGSPDQSLYLSRLPKGESTWSKPELLFSEPDHADGNPVLMTDGDTVHLFFVTVFGRGWEQASIRRIASDDSGETWSEPSFIREQWGWMTGTRAFRMSNGEVLLPVYDEGASSSGFMIADEDMENWQSFPAKHKDWLRAPNGAIQPSVVEVDPGHLIAYMRTSDDDIFRSQSTDYGRTWSTPERTELGNPNSRVALFNLESDHLLVAYNPWIEHRSPMRLSSTSNAEKTWTPPWSFTVDVENLDGPQFTYPYLEQADDGMVHLAYTANRDRMAELVFNEEYLQSGVSMLSQNGYGEGWGATEYRDGQVRAVESCSYGMGEGTPR